MSLQETTAAVKKHAESSDSLGSSIKFVFDEGLIFLDGSGASNAVHNDDQEADCTVTMKKDDLDAMMDGSLNPVAAFMGGKLSIEGDMGVAMKLGTLFS